MEKDLRKLGYVFRENLAEQVHKYVKKISNDMHIEVLVERCGGEPHIAHMYVSSSEPSFRVQIRKDCSLDACIIGILPVLEESLVRAESLIEHHLSDNIVRKDKVLGRNPDTYQAIAMKILNYGIHPRALDRLSDTDVAYLFHVEEKYVSVIRELSNELESAIELSEANRLKKTIRHDYRCY